MANRGVTMRLDSHVGSATSGYEFERRYRRELFTVPLTLRHLAGRGVRTSHGISLDISEGGIGALVQGSLRVGETVAIDLPLLEYALSAVAIVRHTSDVSSGFEFVGLKPEERLMILSVAGNTLSRAPTAQRLPQT